MEMEPALGAVENPGSEDPALGAVETPAAMGDVQAPVVTVQGSEIIPASSAVQGSDNTPVIPEGHDTEFLPDGQWFGTEG